jgi:DNA-binding MarR family transcriptional regulator
MSADRKTACQAWELLTRLLLERRVQLPALAAEFDLSPVQCHVLHLLEPGQPVPMGRLAETLACDASNVTGLVDRLESRGLLARQASPADRRVKVLVLTPAGARVRIQLQKKLSAPPDPFRRLSPSDQRALVRILERLLD